MIRVTNKLFNIADFRKYSGTYVETGTCHGESIKRAMAGHYDTYLSIEAHKPFLLHARDRFKGNDNVIIWFGKSTEYLSQMLKPITSSAVILLDAHAAGPDTFGHEEVMAGNIEYGQDAIIMAELDHILNHRNDHIIIIDDMDDDSASKYAKIIIEANSTYQFFYYNEQLTLQSNFYKNKILVAMPNEMYI